MRIAYFVQLTTLPGAGVNKKIAGQIKQWLKLGHTVKLFLATKDGSLSKDFEFNDPRFEIETAVFGNSRLPPPFDGRLSALTKLRRSVDTWKPHIVYTRQDLYLYPLGRLLSYHPVIVEVNTNDLTELRGANPILRLYYRQTRDILLKRASGHIFVSEEIKEQPHYYYKGVPSTTIGNGIDLATITPGNMAEQTQSLVFIGSAGQTWHGVDKIAKLALVLPEWTFHLIGVSKQDLPDDPPLNIVLHGHLSTQEYSTLMVHAVAAFGTLALHRKAMNEASPLKVREYLGYGLPVIIAYNDTDFPSDESFILKLQNAENNVETSVAEIGSFIKSWQGRRVARSDISFLDYGYKEKLRLQFFEQVVLKSNIQAKQDRS